MAGEGVVELNLAGRDGHRRVRRLFPHWRRDAAALRLLAVVAESRGVAPSLMLHPMRGRAAVAAARQLAMYLTHVLLSRSLSDVGRLFGRDRTTVAYACAAMEDLRDDGAFEAEIESIERSLATPCITATPTGEARYARC